MEIEGGEAFYYIFLPLTIAQKSYDEMWEMEDDEDDEDDDDDVAGNEEVTGDAEAINCGTDVSVLSSPVSA